MNSFQSPSVSSSFDNVYVVFVVWVCKAKTFDKPIQFDIVLQVFKNVKEMLLVSTSEMKILWHLTNHFF